MNEQEREKMIMDNMGLVNHCLTKLLKHKYNEDYFQQGVVELIRCVDNYDSSRGIKFSTYATNNIKWYLKEYIQRDKIIKPKRFKGSGGKVTPIFIDSLDRVVAGGEHNSGEEPITMYDLISDPQDIAFKNDKKVIDNVISILDKALMMNKNKDVEVNLLVDCVFNGYTYNEASAKYQVPFQQVEKIVKRNKKILKREYLLYNDNEE